MKDEMVPLFSVYMSRDVDKPLLEVLHSGYIGEGKKVKEFEKVLSDYLGAPYVVTVNSGTSALYLAYRLSGVQKGLNAITPSQTCWATNAPILANGGSIIWADINPSTGLVDPLDVERKITSNTKAIVTVDWGGTPGAMDELMKIGHKYGIKIIEDAAHSFGATYKNRKVGTLADYTILSFQAIKTMTAGEGGALICKNEEDYKRAKILRWYGIDREAAPLGGDNRIEQDVKEWGLKLHMNDINATIGLEQMKTFPSILAKQRNNALYYNEKIDKYYKRAWETDYLQFSAYWLYSILLPSKEARLRFMRYMKDNNIMVSQVHARNDGHTAVAKFKIPLPNTEIFSDRQVSIPVNWSLTLRQRQRIVRACNEFAQIEKH